MNYYIIGSKYGEKANIDMFPKFLEKSVIATGFAGGHDLNRLFGKSGAIVKHELSLLKEESKSINGLKTFLNIKEGDLIAVKADGSPKGRVPFLSIIGLAEVVAVNGKAYEHDPKELKQTINVRYLYAPIYKVYNIGGFGSTISHVNKQEIINKIFDFDYWDNERVENFKKWLTDVYVQSHGPKLQENTVSKYVSAIKQIHQNCKEAKLTGKYSIFTINDLEALKEIKSNYFTIQVYKDANARGNNMYSSAFDRYIDFIGNNSNTPNPTLLNMTTVPLPPAPLNTILFGPPGTGKTYNSIDKAVRIINGSSASHAESKQAFDSLRNEGQIEFVTFHQNYSYEDFMVGIRPDAETDELRFRPYKGIFYQLVDRAKQNYIASKEESNVARSFDEVFEELISPLEREEEVPVRMASGNSFKVTDVENGTIRFIKPNGSNAHTLSVETLKGIVEGKRDFHSGLGSYYKPLVALIKEKQQVATGPKETLKRFVLIIDEINRANISRVFGELITLLEDDKRLDAENALTITLPNGEKDFGIPPNLYVIGTMNTADKSIALVDIALRRRFEFEGFYPSAEALKGKYDDRIRLLEQLNQAIFEKKKTADYLIGHGYFMKQESTEDILRKKIVPLLMEYFSGRVKEVEEVFEKTSYLIKYDPMKFSWTVTSK